MPLRLLNAPVFLLPACDGLPMVALVGVNVCFSVYSGQCTLYSMFRGGERDTELCLSKLGC